MKRLVNGLLCAVFVVVVVSTMMSCSNGSDDPKYIPTSYSSTNFMAVSRDDGIHFFLATEPKIREYLDCYRDSGMNWTVFEGEKPTIYIGENLYLISSKNDWTNVEMNGVLYDEYVFPFVKNGEIYYFRLGANTFSIKSVGDGIYSNVYDISASINYSDSDKFIEVNISGDFLDKAAENGILKIHIRSSFKTGLYDTIGWFGYEGSGGSYIKKWNSVEEKNQLLNINGNKWSYRFEGDEFIKFKNWLNSIENCGNRLRAEIHMEFSYDESKQPGGGPWRKQNVVVTTNSVKI